MYPELLPRDENKWDRFTAQGTIIIVRRCAKV